MIQHEREYKEFLQKVGVGDHDVVVSSIASYISYLNSVSNILAMDISPETVASEEDVQGIVQKLDGKRAKTTIQNYQSALRRYAEMVKERAAGNVRVWSMNEAQKRFEEVVAGAEAGTLQIITRRGKPVIVISNINREAVLKAYKDGSLSSNKAAAMLGVTQEEIARLAGE